MALGAGGPLRSGAVPRIDLLQTVRDLKETGLGLGTFAGAVVVGASAVLADEGGDDVDMVIGMADGRPAAPRAIAGIDARRGHHSARDLPPLLVGQDAVLDGISYGQMPHVLLGALVGGKELQRLVEKLLEVPLRRARVAAGVGCHAVEGGDQVRVDVLLVGALAVEVVEQAVGVAALLVDLGDQAASPACRLATRSAAACTDLAAR